MIYYILSLLLSPFVISLFAFIILGGNLFIPFVFFFLFPSIITLPYIKNFNVKLHLRPKLILIISIFYLIGTLLMEDKQRFLGLCYFLNSIISLIITRKDKISLHMFGISGPATALFFISDKIYSILLFILIIPTWIVRKKLHAHNNFQLLSGLLAGIFFTLFWVFIFNYY
ncbi:MAG: hypothetical protein QW469_00850 [Candidatus Aenigmatarchaeota archaeon]